MLNQIVASRIKRKISTTDRNKLHQVNRKLSSTDSARVLSGHQGVFDVEIGN